VATTTAIAPPEPQLTAEEIVARARALHERVSAKAADAEERGTYSAELQDEFVAAGFFRILQPRRFGGYEFGLDTFYPVIIEICSADAGIGWNLCPASAHALQLAAFFPEQAQADLFGPDGHFVGPSRAIPRGEATPAPGSYRVSGRWDYCSGATYSTHVVALAVVAGSDERMMVALPRSDYKILDDWGGGAAIGLGGTASNTIVADDAFVPAHRAVRYDWKDFEMPTEGTIGFQLHGNPLYLARAMTFFYASLNATQIGNARLLRCDRPLRRQVRRPRGARRAVHHRRRRRDPRRARPVRQACLAGSRPDVRHQRLERRPARITAGAVLP
jgi:3-hydroxy-9,10-secoandrosta-1,3,5(10)-triene-9,17-dione monooxygenase